MIVVLDADASTGHQRTASSTLTAALRRVLRAQEDACVVVRLEDLGALPRTGLGPGIRLRSAITFIGFPPLSCASLLSPARSCSRASANSTGARGRARRGTGSRSSSWSPATRRRKSTDLAGRLTGPGSGAIPAHSFVQARPLCPSGSRKLKRPGDPREQLRRQLLLVSPCSSRNLLASPELAVPPNCFRPRTSVLFGPCPAGRAVLSGTAYVWCSWPARKQYAAQAPRLVSR